MEERKKIAQWLYDKIKSEECVYQETVVDEIAKKFGDQYTYIEDGNNPRINPGVLYQFRKLNKLNKGKIDWDNQEHCWYFKTDDDT